MGGGGGGVGGAVSLAAVSSQMAQRGWGGNRGPNSGPLGWIDAGT